MDIKTLSTGFQKYPLAMICGLLIGAVVTLFFDNKSLRAEKSRVEANAVLQIVATERRCAEEKDAFRRDLIESYKSALERQQVIEDQIRNLKKKK